MIVPSTAVVYLAPLLIQLLTQEAHANPLMGLLSCIPKPAAYNVHPIVLIDYRLGRSVTLHPPEPIRKDLVRIPHHIHILPSLVWGPRLQYTYSMGGLQRIPDF